MNRCFTVYRGWSDGGMVLGKLPVPGRPTIWIREGQGPTALAVGAGGGCLDIFTLDYTYCPLSPSLWETARYRLKYCLKGPLNPKQPTNQCSIPSLRCLDFPTYSWLNISASKFIPNDWYLKVNFLLPENLLWDISSFR